MDTKTISVTMQFDKGHFDLAYSMLQLQFKDEMPPPDFFTSGPNTEVNISQLDDEQASAMCMFIMAAKISFVGAEAVIDQLKKGDEPPAPSLIIQP